MDAILVLLLILLYFLPTGIALVRGNRVGPVLAINLLLGWTVIGWLLALALALIRSRARAPATPLPAAHEGEPTGQTVDNLLYTRQFLRDAFDRGLVNTSVYTRLITELADRQSRLQAQPAPSPVVVDTSEGPVPAEASSFPPAPPAAPATFEPSLPAPAIAMPVAPEPAALPPAPPPAPRRPAAWSPLIDQLGKARLVVRSDFAVHGLAYLGVLLTFAGTLGFVLFAYTSVENQWLRALGPLAVPLFLGVTSWMLYRRGSVLVSVSLELLGAALVPVLLSAALSTLVPNHGIQFALRASMALALAVIYASAVVRRPASPLKYLVAPMVWTAVWTVGLYVRGNYSPEQVALTAVAIVLTVAGTRLRPRQRFAEPVRFAAFPGIAAVYVLSILFAVTEGRPPLPIFIAGVATILTVELLALHSRQALQVALLQSLVLATSLGAVSQVWGTAAVGALAAFGYLTLLEWQERRRPLTYALFIPLTGVVIGVGLALVSAWPALIAGALVAGWIHARRLWPLPSQEALPAEESRIALMVGAAAFPVAFASGLWRLLPEGRTLLILAGVLVVLTVVIRRWRPADLFYAWWLPASAGAIVIAAASTPGIGPSFELAAAVALAGITLAFAPRWPIARVWSSVIAFSWASILLFDTIHLDAATRPVVWSLAALLVVALASTRQSLTAGHLALVGYIGSAAALFLATSGAVTVVTLAAWTGAWLVAVATQEFRGSPLVLLLQWASRRVLGEGRGGGLAAVLPPFVFVISAPFLVTEAGDFFAITTRNRSWTGIALGITALAYSAAARLTAGRRPLAAVLAIASIPLSGIAIAVAAPDLEPSILTVAGSVAVVGIMGGAMRRPFMSWFAWAMAIVLSLLIAIKAGVAIGSINLVLVCTGGFLLVGGLLYDELRAGLRQPGQGLRIGWLIPPVSLGALAVPVGLAFSFSGAPSVYGWWAIAAAALYLVVGVLLRTGGVSGVSFTLAAFGIATLVPGQPLAHPVLLLPFAAVLVGASIALSYLPFPLWGGSGRGPADLWLRWDIPPLVIAHLVAALALARTTEVGSVAVTWAGFGALSVAVAAWRRHWAWAGAAAILVLVAGQASGHGWFALALAATGAGAALAASRRAVRFLPLAGRPGEGVVRLGLRVFSLMSIAGAWLEVMAWASWSTEQEIAYTTLASGGLALVLAGVARAGRVSVRVAAPWAAMATAGVVSSAAWATALFIGRPFAFAVAAGLALYALACTLAITPSQWPWLAWLTVDALAWAWGETMIGTGWSAGQVTALTAVLAGGLAAVLALLLRLRRLPTSWLDPAAFLTVVALVSAGAASAYLEANLQPDHRLAALGVALGAALSAGATASIAPLLWWPVMAWVAVAAAGWSWVELSLGAGWTVDQGVAFTALAAGVIGIASGALLRVSRLAREWIFSWGSLATIGLGGAIIMEATLGSQRDPYALGVAAGLALYAVGVALAAAPLSGPWLREAAAVLAIASGATVLYDRQPAVEQSVAVAVGAGLAALVVSLGIWRAQPRSAWLRPLALYASLAGGVGLLLALLAWPDRGPLIIALLVIGAEAAAVGLTLRRPTALYASPVLTCAAWLLFSTDALRGNPNWITVPIGLAMLVLVELARWDRRLGTDGPNYAVLTSSLLLLEYAGMAFLVGSALVETVFDSIWYGLLGTMLGIALIGWAAFTRVRRRTEVGAGVVLLSLFLMLIVPVVRLVPQLHDIALWGAVAAVGVLLLVVATTIEQSRARVMAGVRRLDQLMAGWE